MHPNPAFRQDPDTRNIGFARERGFGALAINGPDGPETSHVPFLLDEDGQLAELHLVRSNPIFRACADPTPAVITVTGPDGYISPDWYGIDDQVPTWNYVAIRLRGKLESRPQAELHPMLDRLTAHFENDLQPKKPWTTSKMSPDVMERMMRMIQPFHFKVSDIQGTWKLNQNKSDDVRLSAAEHLRSFGLTPEARVLAALMEGASSLQEP